MNELQTASDIAKLLADPLRLSILQFLTWGPCSVTKLVESTQASQSNVSNHLKLLREGAIVIADKKGRQTFYSIASANVAEVISALSWAASGTDISSSRSSIPAKLLEARACYDHLAGRVGVKLMNGLVAASAITMPVKPWQSIEFGRRAAEVFGTLNFDIAAAIADGARRRFAFACPDWSEHHHSHLGGFLGAALYTHFQTQRWIEREQESRAIILTPEGKDRLDWLLEKVGAAFG